MCCECFRIPRTASILLKTPGAPFSVRCSAVGASHMGRMYRKIIRYRVYHGYGSSVSVRVVDRNDRCLSKEASSFYFHYFTPYSKAHSGEF